MKRILLFLLVIFSITFFTGCVDTESITKDSGELPKDVEYVDVNIDTMEDDLDNNAASAQDKYLNNYYAITGKLSVIDSDLSYISITSFTDEWDILGVHCELKNDEVKNIVKTLSKGDSITVKGKISNMGEVMGFYLDTYEILKN